MLILYGFGKIVISFFDYVAYLPLWKEKMTQPWLIGKEDYFFRMKIMVSSWADYDVSLSD